MPIFNLPLSVKSTTTADVIPGLAVKGVQVLGPEKLPAIISVVARFEGPSITLLAESVVIRVAIFVVAALDETGIETAAIVKDTDAEEEIVTVPVIVITN